MANVFDQFDPAPAARPNVFDQFDEPGPQTAPAQAAPATGVNGHLQQFSSGLNEGLSNVLGLPGDLGNAIVRGGAGLINKVTGSNLQPGSPFYGGQQAAGAMSDMGLIKPANQDPVDQGVRAFGRNAGPMLLTGPASGVGMVKSALMAAGSGAGGAAGNAVGGPTGEAIGSLAGGLTTGGTVAAIDRFLAERAAVKAVPTVDALKASAGAKYDEAAANGTVASPLDTKGLATDMRQVAIDNGVITPKGNILDYPGIKKALTVFDDYGGQTMDVQGMQAVRRILQDAAGSSDANEGRIAVQMIKKLDDFTSNLAPELKDARGLYAGAMRGQDIQQAIDLAKKNTTSGGTSFDSALATQFRGLETRAIKGQLPGMSDAAISAIKDVGHPGPVRMVARSLGQFAPRSLSPADLAASMGPGAAVGFYKAGPVGALVGGGLSAGLGTGARAISDWMARNAASRAGAIARNGGPLSLPQSDAIKRVAAALLAAQGANAAARPQAR